MGADGTSSENGHATGRPGLLRALTLLATYPRRRWTASQARDPDSLVHRASITSLTHEPAPAPSDTSAPPDGTAAGPPAPEPSPRTKL